MPPGRRHDYHCGMLPRRFLALALALLAPVSLPIAGCGGDDAAATTGATGGGAGGSGSGGSGGGGVAPGADHLLITEVMLTPEAGEYVEIWNPTAAEIDLGSYYLSDNGTYFGIAAGDAWAPAGTEGSDFLAQFAPGTRIAPGEVLVIAANADFQLAHGRCADLGLPAEPVDCDGGTLPAMIAPENGGLGTQPGLLTNDGEMLVLFSWSGVVGEPVKDVDYVAWGESLGVSEVADKSGETGYQPDTPMGLQRFAPVPPADQSLQRCALETGEKASGGNGITGHDETSEQLDQSFTVNANISPGELNGCLSAL